MAIAASSTRKRAQERIVRERELFLKDEFNATLVATWEQRSSNRIVKQDLLNRAKHISEKDAEDIKGRQSKIRDLYQNETLQWKKELKESQYVSIEDRIKAIREKATHLQGKRDKEKRDFVNACYDRQWRDGCDEIRTLNAKSRADKLMDDRNHFLEMKKNGCETDKNEERSQIILDAEKKDKKEREEALERERKNLEMKLALDEQVRISQHRSEALVNERKREEAMQLESWTLEGRNVRGKELRSVQEAHIRGEETMIANRKRLDERERDKGLKRQQENILLNYALDKERTDIESESAQKQQNKGAAQEYVKFLEEQMIEEERDMSQVERIRAAEMEKISSQRDADLQAKKDARSKLMIEVNTSRELQIDEKNKRTEEMKHKVANEVKTDIMLWEKQQHDKEVEKAKKKQQTVENMLFNKKTIESKLEQETVEKQKQFLLNKQMVHAEREHQDRIEREAGNVKTHFPRRGTDLFPH